MKPEFITFTGADDNTDITEMRTLSEKYPIEWGVLFSPTRQGRDRRYPSMPTVVVLRVSGLRLSAHLCGGHSRAIMENTLWTFPDLEGFGRIQVNHNAPNVEHISCGTFGHYVRRIAQTRADKFPVDDRVDWLFDQSGGNGRSPVSFPHHPDSARLVGYAGGIGPENVVGVLENIAATGPYWIDMESNVRTNDWFDLGLVRRVCDLVYG